MGKIQVNVAKYYVLTSYLRNRCIKILVYRYKRFLIRDGTVSDQLCWALLLRSLNIPYSF